MTLRHFAITLAASLAFASNARAGEVDDWQTEWIECNSRAGDPQRAYDACVQKARTREDVAQCVTSARGPVDAALAKCRAVLDRRMAFRKEKLAALDRLELPSGWSAQAALEDLEAGPSRVRNEAARLQALAEADPDRETDGVKAIAQKAATQLAAIEASTAQIVSLEKACRASKKCMAERAEQDFVRSTVVPLCEAVWAAQSSERAIAEEKANPSGVVNLVLLHSEGEALQAARHQSAALRTVYRKVRGHDLRRWQDEPACVEAASKPE